MLCSKCEKGNCNYFSQENSPCEECVTCTCKCNVGGPHDRAQKISAVVGGMLGVVSGIGIAVGSSGLLAMAGGTMAGAGFSSITKGIEKTWKKEKIETKDYLLEVGFGAATGLVTGGVGALGEATVNQVTKELVKETVKTSTKNLAARTVTGTGCGLIGKCSNELKQYSKGEKNKNNWWKSLDEEGNEKGALATAGSWLGSGLLGAIGGGISHVSSDWSSRAESEAGQFVTKIIVEAGCNAGVDLSCQIINQKEIDVARTLTIAGTTASSVVVREATTKAAIKWKGGEEKVLEGQKTKAKITNKKTREKVAKLGDELRDPVNNLVLTEQKEKINAYQNERFQEEKTFEEKLKPLEKNQVMVNKGEVRNLGKEINALDQELRQNRNEIGEIRREHELNVQKLAITNPTKEKLGENNIHFRRAGGYKQVVADIGKGKKVFFDFDETSGKHKFVDLVNDRDYSKAPNYGESLEPEISELEYQEPALNWKRKENPNNPLNTEQANNQNLEKVAESENQNEESETADEKVAEEELEQAQENQIEAKIQVLSPNQRK